MNAFHTRRFVAGLSVTTLIARRLAHDIALMAARVVLQRFVAVLSLLRQLQLEQFGKYWLDSSTPDFREKSFTTSAHANKRSMQIK
jgi:hypothetical protein